MTTTTTIEHRVRDFKAWKAAYDQHRPTRDAAHARNDRVYRAIDDPNHVCVVMEFPSPDAAERFVRSDDLRNAMREAGVEGAPQVHIAATALKTT